MHNFIVTIILLFAINLFAQNSKQYQSDINIVAADSVAATYDANKPARAAFYSAILPGLGQAYNKRYWKVPVVYAALGTSVAIYIHNDNQYKELREAYKIRLAGGTNDAFSDSDGNPIISNLGLERAQKRAQRNKELTLLVTAGIYILQIIDANVDGHLEEFNVDRNLSLSPTILNIEQIPAGNHVGVALTYKF